MLARSVPCLFGRLRLGGAMRSVRLLAGIAGVTFLMSGQAAPPRFQRVNDVTADQYYNLALEAQAARDFPEMLRLLRLSGDAGHVAAQEMLGFVLLGGAHLYGKPIKSNICEARDWMGRAVDQGSEIARFHLTVLNRLTQARSAANICRDRDRLFPAGRAELGGRPGSRSAGGAHDEAPGFAGVRAP